MKSSKIRLCLFGTSILNEYISQNYKKNHIEHMCIITHKDDKRDIDWEGTEIDNELFEKIE